MNIVTDQLAIVAGSVLTFTWNHNIRKKKNKEKWGGIDNLYESPRHGLLIYQNPLRYIRLKYSNEICTRPSVPAWSNDLFLLFTTGPRPTPDGMLGHLAWSPPPAALSSPVAIWTSERREELWKWGLKNNRHDSTEPQPEILNQESSAFIATIGRLP